MGGIHPAGLTEKVVEGMGPGEGACEECRKKWHCVR